MTPSITLVGSPNKLEDPRKPEQPGVAVEYEYRCAEYEYDEEPAAARLLSYSVRLADGTRHRTRTRCFTVSSMMFDPSITLVGSPTKLEDPRKPEQPGVAVEYEYRCAEYEYEYDEEPAARLLSYSVRLADGTRHRTRTRCFTVSSMMFDPSITLVGSPNKLEDPRKPEQPGVAVEYEYRCAEYEYEYDEEPAARLLSYSVRLADGTRHRTRTRCFTVSSMMFDPSITLVGSPTKLEDPRKPEQPGVAVEYEYRCAEYEYEYDEEPAAARLLSYSLLRVDPE